MKIATELHRPKWVSLPLVDAILRDDVLISFITPPEFLTEPNLGNLKSLRNRVATAQTYLLPSQPFSSPWRASYSLVGIAHELLFSAIGALYT